MTLPVLFTRPVKPFLKPLCFGSNRFVENVIFENDETRWLEVTGNNHTMNIHEILPGRLDPDVQYRPVVLLVHGLGGDGTQYLEYGLRNKARVFSLNMTYEKARKIDIRDFRSLPQEVGNAVSWLHEKLGQPVNVAGFSLGALSTLFMAAEQKKGELGSIVLASPPLLSRFKMLLLSPLLLGNQIWKRCQQCVGKRPQEMMTLRSLLQLRKMILRAKKQFAKLQVPTLLIFGQNDQLSTPASRDKAHSSIPHRQKRLEILPEQKHFIYYDTDMVHTWMSPDRLKA